MSVKKYGVIWASTSTNIGDEIQTIAAIEFLKVHGITDYIPVDREKLKDYDGEPVNCVFNGWFMHDLKQFPPSDKITPIFISFHCNKPDLIKNNKEYFKKYEPIGCRDTYTLDLFIKNDISAYFTGCLTLILPKSSKPRKGKLLVDVNNNVSYIPKSNVDVSQFSDYKVVTNQIKDVSRKDDFNYRLESAKKLVEQFRTAELVVTSRLHCVLPCRAMGTPVLFIHANYQTDVRFTGLKDILQGSSTLEKCSKTVDRKLIENKVDFFKNFNI
jgi:hypothetical protein